MDRNDNSSYVFLKFKFSYFDFLKIIGILLLATVIAFIFYDIHFAEANIIMVYIVGVLFMPIVTKGYLMGIIGSILSVLSFNYFFTEPRFSFMAYDTSYFATFPIMFFVALITSTLTSRIQQ